MSILKRGSKFQVTVHHKGARYRKTFESEVEAQAWKLSTKAALLRGKDQEILEKKDGNVIPKTLKQLFQMTYEKYWRGTSAEKAAVINAHSCLAFIGEHTLISTIDECVIDRLILFFEKQAIADSTINRKLSALSKMLTYAHERGFIDRKPKIERKKLVENRIKYLEDGEEKEILSYFKFINQLDMVDMVVLAVDTGMRQGELLKLKVKDCCIDGIIRLPAPITKAERFRDIPMTKRVREIVSRRLQGKSDTEKMIEGWTKDRVRHYWDLVRRHLGLMHDDQFVFHMLRHTFCSRLVQRGVPIQIISKLAGHSDIKTTMRYAHLCQKNLRDAIDVLNG